MSNNKTGRTTTKKSSPPSKKISSSPAVAHSGPPIVPTRSFEFNKDTNEFTDTQYITCSPGSRSFFLEVTQYGSRNRVYAVQINIRETLEGKASAGLMVMAAQHQANGASCITDSEFSDATEVKKRKFSCPPVSDRELLMYKFIDDPDSKSVFSLVKKTNSGFVEKITVTHCFSIDEDAFYCLAIKIVVSNGSAGLLVELQGPQKHTGYSMDQRLTKLNHEAVDEMLKQVINSQYNGSTSEDMRLHQALGSYVNTGTQSLRERARESSSRT